MTPYLVAAGLSYVLIRVEKTEYPAIDMNGEILRITGLLVSGNAATLPTFHERVENEGWDTKVLTDGRVMVVPTGHSLGEVTALNFRIQNGEFGNLSAKIYFMPDRKKKR